MQRTECPRCHQVGVNRAEHVTKGGATTTEFSCGFCGHTWVEERPDWRARNAVKPPPDADTPAD